MISSWNVNHKPVKSFVPVNFCHFIFSFWKFSSTLTLRRTGITSYQLRIALWGDLPNGQTVIQVITFGLNLEQYEFYFLSRSGKCMSSEIIIDRKYCHSSHVTVTNTFCKRLSKGQWNGSVGKYTSCQTWCPGLSCQNQHGRKGEPTPLLSFDLYMYTINLSYPHTK